MYAANVRCSNLHRECDISPIVFMDFQLACRLRSPAWVIQPASRCRALITLTYTVKIERKY